MSLTSEMFPDLEEQYSSIRIEADTLRLAAVAYLSKDLEDHGLPLSFPVISRVKSWDSIRDKWASRDGTIRKLSDLQDLIGLRVIVLFSRSLDRVGERIESLFRLKRRYETHRSVETDRFGYASIHYVVEPDESWLAALGLPWRGLPMEVQLRTLAQHLWASASHALQYKVESAVPPELRRSVHRLAGLTELVDLELDRVLTERDEYRSRLKDLDSDAALDVESAAAILNALWPSANRMPDERIDVLMLDLSDTHIKTRRALSVMILRHRQAVLDVERRNVERVNRAIEEGHLVGGDLIVRKPGRTTHMMMNEEVLKRLRQGPSTPFSTSRTPTRDKWTPISSPRARNRLSTGRSSAT